MNLKNLFGTTKRFLRNNGLMLHELYSSLIDYLSVESGAKKDVVIVSVLSNSLSQSKYRLEEAEYSLEYVFHWHQHSRVPYCKPTYNGGFYTLDIDRTAETQHLVKTINEMRDQNTVVVMFSNTNHVFLESCVSTANKSLGLINISQHSLTNSGPTLSSVHSYPLIELRNPGIQILEVGSSSQSLDEDWAQFSINKQVLDSESLDQSNAVLVAQFLERHDEIAIHCELQSIVRGITLSPPFALNLELVTAVFKQITQTGKVTLVQFTGDSEATLVSNEVTQLLDTLREGHQGIS